MTSKHFIGSNRTFRSEIKYQLQTSIDEEHCLDQGFPNLEYMHP